MEQKYTVSLSGNFLNQSTEKVLSNLCEIFLDKQTAEIESLITNKAIIKKSTDLALANKVKSRIEQAGAECLITADEFKIELPKPLQPLEEIKSTTEVDPDKHKTEGAFFISAAVILFLTLFLISDGYDPRFGLLWSVNENMTIYDGHPFGCEEPVYAPSANMYMPGLKISGGCDESFKLTLMTKYFLLTTLIILAFGLGRYLNHFRSTKSYWKSISNRMGWD